MAITRKQPTAVISALDPSSNNNNNSNNTPTKLGIKSTSTLTPPVRKPVKAPSAITTSAISTTTAGNGGGGGGRGMGMGMVTAAVDPPTPAPIVKTFEQSQDELFSKLEELASVKNKARTVEVVRQPSKQHQPQRAQLNHAPATPTSASGHPLQRSQQPQQQQQGVPSTPTRSLMNKSMTFNGSKQHMGNTSTASLKMQPRKTNTMPHQGSNKNGSYNSMQGPGSATSMTYTAPVPERPREPRRRINSAQFKTPSAADMAELAQIVVANASPPKVQNKLRKRASTLSLTTTTFMPPMTMNPSIVVMTPGGVNAHQQLDIDYRQRYEAAAREAKSWEKKFSAAQHQIHYERERWEERYGEIELALKNLEASKAEANVEKMNSLLDTVQQLQLANEAFRKQLETAGIEPDPTPAVEFYSQHLMVGKDLDRTFLEENELMKEKSLVTNQKISHLSSEINNVAIAISQTINYVQLRYLTQMLDAAEHVSTQKRTRAMSNTFLSDMLSRGIKKSGPLQAKNTVSTSTQTRPSTILTALQLQQDDMYGGGGGGGSSMNFRPMETKLSKSFSFTSSLLNLTGLHSNNALSRTSTHTSNNHTEIQYRLKGGAMDDRSQLIHYRGGISPLIVQDLKGGPSSPLTDESLDVLASRRAQKNLDGGDGLEGTLAVVAPKFQYASPTTSQLRIFVPDGKFHPHAFGSASASGGSSMYGGVYGLAGGGHARQASQNSQASQSHGHLPGLMGSSSGGGGSALRLSPAFSRSPLFDEVSMAFAKHQY